MSTNFGIIARKALNDYSSVLKDIDINVGFVIQGGPVMRCLKTHF
jgi:hypothetical protein